MESKFYMSAILEMAKDVAKEEGWIFKRILTML